MTFPDFGSLRPIQPPIIRNYQLEELARLNAQIEHAAAANSATSFVRHIADQVKAFEETLDLESEIGAYLVSFGQAITIHVQSIEAIEPSLVVLVGLTGTEEPVRLVQHVSQLSFLLVRVNRLKPDEPRRPIGFIIQQRD